MILKYDSLEKGACPCIYKILNKSKYQWLITRAKKPLLVLFKISSCKFGYDIAEQFKIVLSGTEIQFSLNREVSLEIDLVYSSIKKSLFLITYK